MTILVQKLAKLYSKLDNHHHRVGHESEELSASLQAFRSQVSKVTAQLAFNLEPRSEILSLTCIQKCFGLLPIINKAFAELIVDIDYPISKWEADSIEGYLSYSLSLLDLFNSFSSSLSRLRQARLFLSYGLNSPSMAIKHLKAIEPGRFSINLGEGLHPGNGKSRVSSGKERVVHEAVEELRSFGFWVCGILLSGLHNDAKPYLELRKMAGGFHSSSVLALDSGISEEIMKKMPVLKEIKEVNDAVAEFVVASDAVKDDAAMELQNKLRVFEKLLEDLTKEVDDLFSKVMTQRTELIDCFRFRKKSQKFVV